MAGSTGVPATPDFYRDAGLFARARGLEAYWEAAVHGLAGNRHVIDIRKLGLVAAIAAQLTHIE
jgi:beta-alanine--pyruvate transaminase